MKTKKRKNPTDMADAQREAQVEPTERLNRLIEKLDNAKRALQKVRSKLEQEHEIEEE